MWIGLDWIGLNWPWKLRSGGVVYLVRVPIPIPVRYLFIKYLVLDTYKLNEILIRIESNLTM